MVAGIKMIDPNIRICGYGHIGDGNLHFNLVQAAGGDRILMKKCHSF